MGDFLQGAAGQQQTQDPLGGLLQLGGSVGGGLLGGPLGASLGGMLGGALGGAFGGGGTTGGQEAYLLATFGTGDVPTIRARLCGLGVPNCEALGVTVPVTLPLSAYGITPAQALGLQGANLGSNLPVPMPPIETTGGFLQQCARYAWGGVKGTLKRYVPAIAAIVAAEVLASYLRKGGPANETEAIVCNSTDRAKLRSAICSAMRLHAPSHAGAKQFVQQFCRPCPVPSVGRRCCSTRSYRLRVCC